MEQVAMFSHVFLFFVLKWVNCERLSAFALYGFRGPLNSSWGACPTDNVSGATQTSLNIARTSLFTKLLLWNMCVIFEQEMIRNALKTQTAWCAQPCLRHGTQGILRKSSNQSQELK